MLEEAFSIDSLPDGGNAFLSNGIFVTFMLEDPESVARTLRPLSGVKDVDIVGFPSGKELWVTLRSPIDLERLVLVSDLLGFTVIKHGVWVSKLPRSLAELIWDGLTYVVTRRSHAPEKHESAAQIRKDLATGDTIYQVVDDLGLTILQDYLKT